MWVSYHRSMRGAHLLFGSQPPSSSSKGSDSERGASSLTILVGGSSMAISFPLWGEELSPFTGVMTGYLIGVDWWGCFKKEDTVKEKE